MDASAPADLRASVMFSAKRYVFPADCFLHFISRDLVSRSKYNTQYFLLNTCSFIFVSALLAERSSPYPFVLFPRELVFLLQTSSAIAI